MDLDKSNVHALFIEILTKLQKLRIIHNFQSRPLFKSVQVGNAAETV